MSDFEYTTIEQQIQKLKSQHLTVEDEEFAASALRTYGYYNIINGYRDPYIVRAYDGKSYCPGITFEQIFALFRLDHVIRNAVLFAMIDLEEHLRALVSEIIGKSFGTNHVEYLKKENYRDKQVSNPKFSRNRVLASLNALANSSYKEPIKYYREEHNIVPPWILLKGTDFGTLVNYIRILKDSQRDDLTKAIYGSKVTPQNIEKFKDLLSDTLFLCLEYRNMSAHGGRIYNYVPKSIIRNFESYNTAGLGILLECVSLLSYVQPYSQLSNSINIAVSDYCANFPNDVHRLEQALGSDIHIDTHVLVNERSMKYHTQPHCSGTTNAIEMTLQDAIEKGFSPCKRCCK